MKDLFGEVPPVGRDDRPVDIVLLEYVSSSTDKAWALYQPPRGALKYAPRSAVKRGEGPRANVWTMPRWLADDRGWL